MKYQIKFKNKFVRYEEPTYILSEDEVHVGLFKHNNEINMICGYETTEEKTCELDRNDFESDDFCRSCKMQLKEIIEFGHKYL